MIGFLPNGVPFKAEVIPPAEATDVDFEAMWDKLLDVSSPEVRDAYRSYDKSRHTKHRES